MRTSQFFQGRVRTTKLNEKFVAAIYLPNGRVIVVEKGRDEKLKKASQF
jgi:hypothetical protein